MTAYETGPSEEGPVTIGSTRRETPRCFGNQSDTSLYNWTSGMDVLEGLKKRKRS